MLKKLLIGIFAFVLVTSNCYGQINQVKSIEKVTSIFKECDKKKYEDDVLHTYQHTASGLKVIWIENKDTNKSFTLGVRTPTTDSTGVNHIIEHTIFTGSKKYPSSSLFFDASSSYPHVYMNALTTGDMTIFPFSTPYMSSYNALLDIYLDSIFHPNFLEQPYGFYEESFNYAPDEKRSGGVVYNEMKGAYGNEDRKIYRSIRQTIYKDTPYSYDSGGDPNEIPKLTYSQFIETYHRYYYPGNMQVILYGDLPVEEVLTKIATYLEGIEAPQKCVNLEVANLNVPQRAQCRVLNENSKCALAKSFVMPRHLSVAEEVQMDLWINAYLGGHLSPMQQALQKAGCQEVKILKDDDLPYVMYTLVVKNVPSEKLDVYNAVLDEMLMKISATRDQTTEEDVLLESKWGQMQSEEDEERGIFIPQTILDGWAHGKDENQYYERKAYLEDLTNIDQEACVALWKEAKICTFFLMPGNMQVLDPVQLSSVTEDEWGQITTKMGDWQKQKCPLQGVPLEEMVLEEGLNLKEKKKDRYTLLTTKAQTEFARSQLYYKTAHVKQEDLPYLFLYSYLLEESSKEQTPFKGILKTNCIAMPQKEDYTPYLKITLLTAKEEKVHGNILQEARENLLNKETEWYQYKLKKLINNSRAASQNNVLGTLANLSLGSTSGAKRYVYEQGYPFYEWCEAQLISQSANWVQKIKEMDQNVYQTDGLIVAVTSPYQSARRYVTSLDKIITQQAAIKDAQAAYAFKQMPPMSILTLDSAVDYIYMQNTMPQLATGSDYVVASYMAKNYLNPQIRIQLGAYGASSNCQYPYTFNIYTYRDPDYSRSLEVIKGCTKFLETTPITEEALKTSKTEALTRVHQQFNLLDKGLKQADVLEGQYLLGNTNDTIKNLQLQVLETTEATIRQKSYIFEKMFKEGSLSVATKKAPQNVSNLKIYQFK